MARNVPPYQPFGERDPFAQHFDIQRRKRHEASRAEELADMASQEAKTSEHHERAANLYLDAANKHAAHGDDQRSNDMQAASYKHKQLAEQARAQEAGQLSMFKSEPSLTDLARGIAAAEQLRKSLEKAEDPPHIRRIFEEVDRDRQLPIRGEVSIGTSAGPLPATPRIVGADNVARFKDLFGVCKEPGCVKQHGHTTPHSEPSKGGGRRR